MQVEISMHMCMRPLTVQNKAGGRRREGCAIGWGLAQFMLLRACAKLYGAQEV